ncbi:hypothetical protein [Thermococcus indicus]|uniref:hypothetical protein n=1 Tax=Thermococcus indicus TaxID=2586643 RepID=UPI00143D2F9F|nr:hypothetical protein [Thermococcus indicus]
MSREPQERDDEEKEFIEGMLRLLEPLLAEDWNTEADEWWDYVKGRRHKHI